MSRDFPRGEENGGKFKLTLTYTVLDKLLEFLHSVREKKKINLTGGNTLFSLLLTILVMSLFD